jgi:hypothetical protein
VRLKESAAEYERHIVAGLTQVFSNVGFEGADVPNVGKRTEQSNFHNLIPEDQQK